MKETTLNFIKELTRADTKTLSQKGLKVAEEAGELASAILPYDNAAGTIHRFIAKEAILEEVADVYLTSVSIAYELGFTDDEIEEMIERKMEKWAKLQKGEDNIKFPLPYEIHITVSIGNDHEQLEAEIEAFRAACKEIGVKPIILDLQMRNGSVTDYMTSSKHYGDNRSAYEEMQRISGWLKQCAFKVVREKIETVPWHPAAPTKARPTMPAGCYFETHISVIVSSDKEKERLGWIVGDFNDQIAHSDAARLSRNTFKTLEDGSFIQMVTYRMYKGTYFDFKEKSAMLRSEIKYRNLTIENVVTEFSIYDTKVSHDTAWINADVCN